MDVLLDSGVEPNSDDTTLQSMQFIESEKVVEEFMETLNSMQKERLRMKMDNPNLSLRELASKFNVTKTSIVKTFEVIKRKYKNFLEKRCPK